MILTIFSNINLDGIIVLTLVGIIVNACLWTLYSDMCSNIKREIQDYISKIELDKEKREAQFIALTKYHILDGQVYTYNEAVQHRFDSLFSNPKTLKKVTEHFYVVI